MISIGRGSFSVVPTLARLILPPVRTTPPPSARQNSALMASRWLSIMNCAPTSGAPSSPDSARKMTSRSSARVGALELQHQHQAGDQVVLVVDRAATVDVAAVALGAEGRMGPLLRIDRHHVGVSHHQERPLLAVALEPGDEVGPLRVLGEHLERDALLLEDLLEILDGSNLVAGRAAGVELHQGLEVRQRLGLERRVGLGLRRQAAERGGESRG